MVNLEIYSYDHQDYVKEIVFLNDINDQQFFIATCSNDETIKIWMVNNSKLKQVFLWQTLHGHQNWVNRIVYLKQKKLLISTSRDKTVRVWNLQQNKLVKSFNDHSHFVFGINYIQETDQIIQTSYDGKLIVRDLQKIQAQIFLPYEKLMEIITYKIDSHYNILVGTYDGNLLLFKINGEIQKNKEVQQAHQGFICRIIKTNNDLIVTGAHNDSKIKVWTLQLQLKLNLSVFPDSSAFDGIYGMCLNQNENQIFVAGNKKQIKIVHLQSPYKIYSYDQNESFWIQGPILNLQTKQIIINAGGGFIPQTNIFKGIINFQFY